MRRFDWLAWGVVFAVCASHCGGSSGNHAASSPGSDSGGGHGGGIDASGTSSSSSGGSDSGDSGSSSTPLDSGPLDAGPPPPDPCIEAGSCAPGTWIDVTPTSVSLTTGSCGNYGTESVAIDPHRPQNIYTQFNCQGIWESTDYGNTWTGPINTGSNGSNITDMAGGISLPSSSATEPPVIYAAGIRGTGTGFWRSTNGGVDWTNYVVGPASSSRQDVYPPSADPYDPNHLLIAGHEQDLLAESTNGGETWTNVPLNTGMITNGGTGGIAFVDMGVAATTRTNWIWIAQQSGGMYGTWRTSNSGSTWTQVDTNEHPHGGTQFYQPGSGVVYMAGAYSALGWGVLRSSDFAATWTHVGGTSVEAVVFGTPANVYSAYGWAAGAGQTVDPNLEIAPQPGTGTWANATTPTSMTQGPVQVGVTSDGTHSIIVAACFNGGLWRYIEP